MRQLLEGRATDYCVEGAMVDCTTGFTVSGNAAKRSSAGTGGKLYSAGSCRSYVSSTFCRRDQMRACFLPAVGRSGVRLYVGRSNSPPFAAIAACRAWRRL